MATITEAAEHLCMSPQRIQQLQAEGVLRRYGRRAVDMGEVRRAYIEHLRAVAAGRMTNGEGAALNLEKERARLAKAQADERELKNAQLRGELIPAAEVVAGWQAAIGRARSLLLGLPPAAAEELCVLAADGPGKVRERLADMIAEALTELANTSLDDLDDEAGEDG